MHDRRKSFGGNVSGVAMEFKLLGMENITKIENPVLQEGTEKEAEDFHKLPEYTFRDPH